MRVFWSALAEALEFCKHIPNGHQLFWLVTPDPETFYSQMVCPPQKCARPFVPTRTDLVPEADRITADGNPLTRLFSATRCYRDRAEFVEEPAFSGCPYRKRAFTTLERLQWWSCTALTCRSPHATISMDDSSPGESAGRFLDRLLEHLLREQPGALMSLVYLKVEKPCTDSVCGSTTLAGILSGSLVYHLVPSMCWQVPRDATLPWLRIPGA